MRPVMVLSLIIALAGLSVGCDVTAVGEENALSFRFDTDDRVVPVSFSTPVAVGYQAVVVVNATSGASGAVTAASSSDASVIAVAKTSGSRITVAAASAGTADLVVTSGALKDRVSMEAREVAEVDLVYPGLFLVPELPPVRVAQGGTARFGVTLKDADGRLLIGSGAFPVLVTPASAGMVETSEDVAHVNVRFDAVGTATVQADGDDALTVEVVPVDELAAIRFEGAVDLIGGTSGVFALRGELAGGERVVGLAGLATVESLTEAVCTISAAPTLGDAVYQITAESEGDCSLTASVGETTGTAMLKVTAP